VDNTFEKMSRKEKRFARIIALKAVYACEVSQIEVGNSIEIIYTAIDNDYKELDKLIDFYKTNEEICFFWRDVNPKTRNEKVKLLKNHSPEFTDRYVKWHNWSIIDELDKMPSTDVIRYSGKLARLAIDNQESSDELIVDRLRNWEMKRVSLIDRLILRLEISEMLHEESVPPKVSIVEGVEIAKLFSTDDSSRFVNGILDSVYNDSLKGLIKFKK
jgi:transcription antitermination factor NusB